MRPLPTSSDGQSRDMRNDYADSLSQVTPTAALSCFFATEADIHASGSTDLGNSKDHGYTVPKDAISVAGRSDISGPSGQSPRQRSKPDGSRRSRPVTPVMATLGPDFANSFPSSPGDTSSLSLSEDPNSLAASFLELPSRNSPIPLRTAFDSKGPIPQLVMPSLSVPQRQPFSEVGKLLGNLKLLVTGQEGIGKTSLIRAIAQLSSHIVHMDPISESLDGKVSETYASTKPCPWWQSEFRGSASPQRRKSSSAEEILNRNICFAECPAPGAGAPNTSSILYAEATLTQLADTSLDDADVLALLKSGARENIDAVLYLLPHTGPRSSDLNSMRQLQEITNVIPLLARADELSAEELAQSRDESQELLEQGGVDWFKFIHPEEEHDGTGLYTVSSASEPDDDIWDASILMNSDYLPSLMPTDLQVLVAEIFSVDGSHWLRHSAAAKGAQWVSQRKREGFMQSALTCRLRSEPPWTHTVYHGNMAHNIYGQGRVTVSNWADGLRQSLLTERLSISQEILAEKPDDRKASMVLTKHHQACTSGARALLQSSSVGQDPLGLLELVSQARAGGRVALELLGSFGIIGCVATCIIRPELLQYWDIDVSAAMCLS